MTHTSPTHTVHTLQSLTVTMNRTEPEIMSETSLRLLSVHLLTSPPVGSCFMIALWSLLTYSPCRARFPTNLRAAARRRLRRSPVGPAAGNEVCLRAKCAGTDL